MTPVEITVSRPSDEYTDSADDTPTLARPDQPVNLGRPQNSRSSEQSPKIGIKIEKHEKTRLRNPTPLETESSHDGSECGDDESQLSTRLQQQNDKLRAERDKAAADRDDYKTKHDALLAERSNLKRRRLWASTAKVQRAFLELASRVAAWCDEASNVGANHASQRDIEPRAVGVSFLKARKSVPPAAPSSTKVGYVNRIVWQELASRAFPKEMTVFDRETDLWVDAKDGEWIADVVKRMESKVSVDDLRLWICMTAVALRPGPDQYNRRLIKIMERICFKVNAYIGLNRDQPSSSIIDQSDSMLKDALVMTESAEATLETNLHPALLALKAKLIFEILPKVAELSWMLRRCPLRTFVRWPPKSELDGMNDHGKSPVLITPELMAFEYVAGAEQRRILVASQILQEDNKETLNKARRLDSMRVSIKSVFGR